MFVWYAILFNTPPSMQTNYGIDLRPSIAVSLE